MATNKFLSTKAFHPGSKANRTRVFQAEERAASDEAKKKERASVLAREQEHFGRAAAGRVGQLAFMYTQPREAAGGVGARAELLAAEALEQARLSETRLRKGAGDEWCTRCNVRGHAAGGAACPLRESDATNPFAQRLEDPHALIELRKRQLRREGAIDAGAVLNVTFQRHVDLDDPNNQLLDVPEHELPDAEEEELRAERKFLATLSTEDRAMLVRHFAGEVKEKKRIKKEHKKQKKEQKRRAKDKDKQRKDIKRIKTDQ